MATSFTPRAFAVAAALVFAAGCGSDQHDRSDRTPPLPPSELRATTDRDDGVLLAWLPPLAAEAISIERDGIEIARLEPEASGYEDLDAEAGAAFAAELDPVSSSFDALSLSWTPPGTVDGAIHAYVVVAHFAKGEPQRSEPVIGGRLAPRIVSILLERDGELVATLDPDESTFVDVEAGAWSIEPHELDAEGDIDAVGLSWTRPQPRPGTLHAYQIVAQLEGGGSVASERVEGRREAPVFTGFSLHRDGEPIATIEPDVDSYVDLEAAPGSIGDLILTAGEPSNLGVELLWNEPERQQGVSYEYSLVAHFDGADELAALPALAGREAPHIHSLLLFRDEEELDRLLPSWTRHEDQNATAATLHPPTLQASAGSRADGVELIWTEEPPTRIPHVYELVAELAGGGELVANSVTAAREPPALLGYKLTTFREEIDLPPGQTSHLDQGAGAGRTFLSDLTATMDRHGSVLLAWEAGSGTEGASENYSLVTFYDGASEMIAFANGNRGAPEIGGFIVYRDGEALTQLPPSSAGHEDEAAAAPPPLTIHNFAAEPVNGGAIHIRWTQANSALGDAHLYEVSAVSEFGDEGPRLWASGARKIERSSLRLLRDGVDISGPGAESPYSDATVDQASVNPPTLTASDDRDGEVLLTWTDPLVVEASTYSYQLVSTMSDGTEVRSDEIQAGSHSPKLQYFSIFTDGAMTRGYVEPEVRSLVLPAPRGSISMDLSVSEGTVDEGVDLGWTVIATEPQSHRYEIEAAFFVGSDRQEFRSEGVSGRSGAPSPTEFRVLRGTDLLATLDPAARGWQDRDVPRSATGPQQVWTTHDRSDAVGLTWSDPLPSSPTYLYRVEMDSQADSTFRNKIGFRRQLSLEGFRILRDGEEAGIVGPDARAFGDTGASYTSGVIHSLQASQGSRQDGVEISWELNAPLGISHTYRVEALYEGGLSETGVQSPQGFRLPPTVQTFEVKRDDGFWTPIGPGTTWLDTDAPDGKITLPTVSLSVEPFLAYVRLERGDAAFEAPDPSTYQVRAVYAEGAPPTISPAFQGVRAFVSKPISYWWMRGEGDPAGGFGVLQGGAPPVKYDLDLTVDVDTWYRLDVLVDGEPRKLGELLHAKVPGVKRVAAGHYTTCVIRTDGTLACVGYANDGLTSPPEGRFMEIAAGPYHFCALAEDGDAHCWGENLEGEAPALPIPGPFTSLSSRMRASCGTRSDGTYTCWGAPMIGTPAPPPFSELGISMLTGCGLRPDDSVNCWGYGTVPSFPGSYQQVIADEEYACALDLSGGVECHGLQAPTGTFLTIAGGDRLACGIRDIGAVSCWGNGFDGQEDPSPGRIYHQVAAGPGYACAVRSDHKLYCWGTDDQGRAPQRP